MRTLKFSAILIAVSLFILVGCDKGSDDEEITPKYLVDFQEVNPSVPFNVENAKAALKQYGMVDLAAKLKYEIKIYKVNYKTLFEGDSIIVSGLIAAPVALEKGEEFPILSYQHGTLFEKSQAPSVNINGEFMTFLASTGMVIVMADYIGFGASSADFHPFMHNQYTVNAVLDMIRASKEFVATEKPCKVNDHLFMFGYSQGGSATLGSVSAIENNNANSDLNVTAAVCGAGAYNLIELRKWIVKQARYEQPSFIGYILESYTRYADVDIEYSEVFSPEYAALIPDMFDGKTSGEVINAQFGTFHVGELLNDNFEKDEVFNTDSVYASLKKAFEDNTINAWPITTSLSIYYGSEDTWVPGDQSLNMFKQFQTNGSGAKVKLKRLEGKNHFTALEPTITESLNWFLSF